NWIDLPPGRFAQKPDAGDLETAAADAGDAQAAAAAGGAPEAAATPSPGSSPCTTYYLDEDGDGYGAVPLSDCDGSPPPFGYVAVGGDCCDVDASVHPGQLASFTAASACGSFDYDCDGVEQPRDASCRLGCGVPCLHSSTTAVPPEACR
ncbi:MAG TPA: hypothetical protein VHL80_08400, partial [Polyangia bacterium]|nr:hypothetical protein [Polyangia bacterium]